MELVVTSALRVAVGRGPELTHGNHNNVVEGSLVVQCSHAVEGVDGGDVVEELVLEDVVDAPAEVDVNSHSREGTSLRSNPHLLEEEGKCAVWTLLCIILPVAH